ncbi:MAG: extracellular solute-binding protein [bacterium]|nr:extracellular solute-binding protein [bacterium]
MNKNTGSIRSLPVDASLSPFAHGISRRQAISTLASAGILVTSVPFTMRAQASDHHPLVFTWDGYNVPELHVPYSDKYGRSPEFSLFGGLDEAFAKHLSGFVPDITTPGAETIERWRDAGIIVPTDTSKLSNWPDLFDGLKTQAPAFENGQQWAVPFAWGGSAVVYRPDLAPEYADNPTWDILWDPKYEGRLSMRDDSTDSVVTAAIVAGVDDPFNMTDDDIAKCRALLTEQRPLLRYYWSDATSMEQSMATGEVVASYGWTSSVSILKSQGVPVEFMVPKEGMIVWIDFLSICNGATASEEKMYDYIDSVISPESGAFLLGEWAVASPNRKAYDLVDLEMIRELGLDNADAVTDAGVLLIPFSVESQPKVVAMFDEVKSGF